MSAKQHSPRTIYEGEGVSTHECDDCGRQGAYYPVTDQRVGPLADEACDADG